MSRPSVRRFAAGLRAGFLALPGALALGCTREGENRGYREYQWEKRVCGGFACEQTPMCTCVSPLGTMGLLLTAPPACGLSPSLPPRAPPAGKRSEMLCSPLRHSFQGRRLLVIDLQSCYKSHAKGSLPRWLSTAASIVHGLAGLVASKGGFNHSLLLPDSI